jgi:hypothetical protein
MEARNTRSCCKIATRLLLFVLLGESNIVCHSLAYSVGNWPYRSPHTHTLNWRRATRLPAGCTKWLKSTKSVA